MNSSSLRCVILRSYFPVAFLVGVILVILDAIMAPVHGQVRTVTVTVYVTLVHTMPVYVPVTAYVTVASVATSFMTLTSTAVSLSLRTVTLWNTITAVTTAAGILGPVPGTIFGPYTDLGIMGIGAAAGGLFTSLFSSAMLRRSHKSTLTNLDMTDAFTKIDERSNDLIDQVIGAAGQTSGSSNVNTSGLEDETSSLYELVKKYGKWLAKLFGR